MLTRRGGWWVLSGAVALAGVVALPALAEPEVSVNGNTMTAPSYVTAGHMMVPLAEVVGRLPGSTVEWLPAIRGVVVRRGGQEIALNFESGYAHVNGRDVVLASPAVVRGQRLMVPSAFFRELFGVTVAYNAGTDFVAIADGSPEGLALGYRASQRTANADTLGVVSIDGVEVITVRGSGEHASLPARVRAITARLNHAMGAVGASGGFPGEQVRLGGSAAYPSVYVGENAVVGVGGGDARLANVSQAQLGNLWVSEVRAALTTLYGTSD